MEVGGRMKGEAAMEARIYSTMGGSAVPKCNNVSVGNIGKK